MSSSCCRRTDLDLTDWNLALDSSSSSVVVRRVVESRAEFKVDRISCGLSCSELFETGHRNRSNKEVYHIDGLSTCHPPHLEVKDTASGGSSSSSVASSYRTNKSSNVSLNVSSGLTCHHCLRRGRNHRRHQPVNAATEAWLRRRHHHHHHHHHRQSSSSSR